MQATMIAAGSRGDVQPYVALGAGLRRAGHSVRVLASPDFRELITAHRLEFIDLGASLQAVAQGMDGQLESGNMLTILSTMGSAARRLVAEAVTKGLGACTGSDLILAGLGGLAVGFALHEKLGIPFVPAYLYPFTPTSEFGSVLSPFRVGRLPGWAHRLSHRMAQQMIWQPFRGADTEARREILGLPPAPFWGPFGALERSDHPTLCGYSVHVVPAPRDWPESIHVTGYWFLDPSPDWRPPAALMEFLDAGDPPVYIGFGSMVNRRPEEVAALVVEAVERAGLRAVVASGWGGLSGVRLPERVFMIGSVPHTWLFPRMAAIVHHGGVGTTAAGLRAGVPSLAIPFFGDQPYWGSRLADLGVGPKPIPRARLSADRLEAALRTATTDAAMRLRAARLGEAIRAEDGTRTAVRVLETWLAGGKA